MRCAGVRGMSERSSFFHQRGLVARKMLAAGMTRPMNQVHQRPLAAVEGRLCRGCQRAATREREIWVRAYIVGLMTSPKKTRPSHSRTIIAALNVILRTLREVKVAFSCRRAISSSRGCLQVPGLSEMGRALVGVDFGVLVATFLKTADILDSILGRRASRCVVDFRTRLCSQS